MVQIVWKPGSPVSPSPRGASPVTQGASRTSSPWKMDLSRARQDFAQLQGREVVRMRHGASELDALAQTLADALAVVHPFVRHSRRALVVVDGLARRVAQPGELLGQCHAGDLRPGLGKPLGRILDGGHGFRLGRAPHWRAAEPDTRSALQRLAAGRA